MVPVSAMRCAADRKGGSMLDLIFIGLVLLFFAAAWAFSRGCDRL